MNLKTSEGKLIFGDCLDVMDSLADRSIDLVFADLPYGVTGLAWDTPLDLDRMWDHLDRICPPRAPLIFTTTQPFTSRLVMSRPGWFRVEWIWVKPRGSNFQSCGAQPLKIHESVLVFCRSTPRYFPQGLIRVDAHRKNRQSQIAKINPDREDYVAKWTNYPKTLIPFEMERGLHETQKPVKLVEYFIRTYSRPGDRILDPTAGSGTTALAAMNTGRRFVLIENDQDHFTTARQRILNHRPKTKRKHPKPLRKTTPT